MKLLLSLVLVVATTGGLSSAPEDQMKGVSEDILTRELSKIPHSTASHLNIFQFLFADSERDIPACILRVVRRWREAGERGAEESSVWGEADEGGDVEERAEAQAPHGFFETQR